MKINGIEATTPVWSLWAHGDRTFLLSDDTDGRDALVRVSTVEVAVEGEALVASSPAWNGETTELVGEGAFTPLHETAWNRHLETLGIDFGDVSRIVRDDFMPTAYQAREYRP